jgi:trimethylguanosine synthase
MLKPAETFTNHTPASSKIAAQLAEVSPSNKRTLIDAFAGAGGNTIAFALSGRWDEIFAIEKDPATLACAKHNAKIYGVEDKIWWILNSVAQNAVIFGSPPWGGMWLSIPQRELCLTARNSRSNIYDIQRF